MTRSVRWVRGFAARFCSAATRERLVDPILADIELERHEMLAAGRVWLARWVVLRGHLGLCTALALHAVLRCSWQPDEASKRTMVFFAAAFVLLTCLLSVPPLIHNGLWRGIVVIYGIPQAILIAIPIALACGVAFGWSGDATARAMLRRVLMLVVAGTTLSLATMEWLVPAANQGFRVAALERLAGANPERRTLSRGINDRSLSELLTLVRRASPRRGLADADRAEAEIRELLRGMRLPRTVERLRVDIHVRAALCVATVPIALVAVATAGAVRRRTPARILFGSLTLAYVLSFAGLPRITHDLLPPPLSAWLATAAMAAVSLLLFGIGVVRTAEGRRV